MNNSNTNRHLPAAVLTLLLLSSSVHAEIYKWVDENGKTHYSETKPDAAKAKTLELKVAPQTAPAQQPTAGGSTQSWQEQERRLKQRQTEEAIDKASRSAESPRPRSLSGGRENGTDASRCNLARDVLNGSLRHGNGAPIDKNDIDIAKSDIRTFCH